MSSLPLQIIRFSLGIVGASSCFSTTARIEFYKNSLCHASAKAAVISSGKMNSINHDKMDDSIKRGMQTKKHIHS